MPGKMVAVPYLASSEWYAEWLNALTLCHNEEKAASMANASSASAARDFTRCLISTAGQSRWLTIPVEGGGARLKRVSSVREVAISEHGNWRHVHKGALNAIYGKSPLFQHLMPRLADAYDANEKMLGSFNASLHTIIVDTLLSGLAFAAEGIPDIRGNTAAIARGKELAAAISPGISVVDPLMRFGRETLLALFAMRRQPS